METAVSAGIIGLGIGAQYALLSLGFTLTYGIVGVINFAHGGFYMMGGYVAFFVVSKLGMPYPLAVLIATLACAALGALFELAVLERHINDHLATMMLTMGLYLVMGTALVLVFGTEPVEFHAPVSGTWRSGRIYVPYANLVVLGACVAAIAAFYLLLYRTNLGRALRAIADDRPVATALGLHPKVLFPAAFGVSTGLAGFTGALVTPILSLHPHVGDSILSVSFMIVILGGLGSVVGAAVAAFIVGLVEAYSSIYLGGSIGALTLFVLVLVTLGLRPTGLFGRPTRAA
jgi:branched-chain amino acid transport system permease protein